MNPAGGCLPLLLQMPILFAFYRLLCTAVELRGAPWILWIQDLSAADPYLVLPIVMGVIAVPPGQAARRRRATRCSGGCSAHAAVHDLPLPGVPSGLVLYWLTNNVLTILQHSGLQPSAERAAEEERARHAEEGTTRSAMNDAKRRFFSGDSLQQALVQAANHFNLDPEDIAYRSIEKRHGFLKARRKVVIEVNPDAPKREKAAPATAGCASGLRHHRRSAPASSGAGPSCARAVRAGGAPGKASRATAAGTEPRRDRGGREPRRRQEERPPPRGGSRGIRERRSPPRPAPERQEEHGLVTLPDTPRASHGTLSGGLRSGRRGGDRRRVELLLRIAGLELAPRILQGEDRLEVDLSGADVDWCFADDGELVMAIEHLLPRLIRSISGETTARAGRLRQLPGDPGGAAAQPGAADRRGGSPARQAAHPGAHEPGRPADHPHDPGGRPRRGHRERRRRLLQADHVSGRRS